MTPQIFYGLDAAATRSTGTNAANVNSLNFGPFLRGKLGRKLEFDLAGGATLVSTKPSIGPSYYLNAALRYQLDRYIQILLSRARADLYHRHRSYPAKLCPAGGKVGLYPHHVA
jgi:hypothetical protein